MNIHGITNLNQYAAIQAAKSKVQDKTTSQSTVKSEAPKNESSLDTVEKLDISAYKPDPGRPLDDAEIEKRLKAREATRNFDESSVSGQHINPDRLELEKEKSAKFGPIQNKLLSGQRLSGEEKSFLQKHYPELYAKAVQIEQEMKDFGDKLKSSKSKDEAGRIYMEQKMQLLSAGSKDGTMLFMSAALDEAYRSYMQ